MGYNQILTNCSLIINIRRVDLPVGQSFNVRRVFSYRSKLREQSTCPYSYPSKAADKDLNTDKADFLELSQELLERGALLRFQAQGSSMHPFIKSGDIIVIEPRNGNSVITGDIIFYRRPDGSPTAHRLLRIKGRKGNISLITKGDAMKYSDPPVTGAQVMGRVMLIEGRGRELRLEGWPECFFSRLTAWFARGRYPNQRRIVKYIDRFVWVCLGRRAK